MNKNILFLNLLVLFIFLSAQVYSQQSVNSSGGDAIGSGGSVAFSIGQVVYTTSYGSGGNCNQGVQQPEIQNSTKIEEITDVISCSLFPNPANDIITLSLSGNLDENITYEIISVSGKLLSSGSIINSLIEINIEQYIPSLYLVKISKNNVPFKYIKFIKK